MPKLSEVLEALARNVPWQQHYPHDAELLDEFIAELKADESKPKRGPKPKPEAESEEDA